MRYVEGSDLARVVAEDGALEPKRAVDLLAQVAEALDAAHEPGLVHRDVKPSNVLIAEPPAREHCYLTDFGLTKRTGSLSGVSAPATIVGTLEYVAPEQITGDALDERADVYSLGCVLYECLTGQSPFPRATDVALLWAHVHEEPTPPSEARPDLPKELDTVLARALAKEPGRRYRSAGELLAATRSALRLVDAPPPARKASRRGPRGALRALVSWRWQASWPSLLRGGSGGLSSVSPNSVGVIDPGVEQARRRGAGRPRPAGGHDGRGGVWVANVDDETVSRIDPADSRPRPATISVGDYPSDLTVGAGSVWVALGALAELVRINPEQNEAASPISALGATARGVAHRASVTFGDGFVWFVCEVGALGRIERRDRQVPSLGFEAGLLVHHRSPRFVRRRLRTRLALDRESGHERGRRGRPADEPEAGEVTVGQRPTAIAVGADSLWVANFERRHGHAHRDARAGGDPAVHDIPVGDGPVDVAVDEGAVWVVEPARPDGDADRPGVGRRRRDDRDRQRPAAHRRRRRRSCGSPSELRRTTRSSPTPRGRSV